MQSSSSWGLGSVWGFIKNKLTGIGTETEDELSPSPPREPAPLQTRRLPAGDTPATTLTRRGQEVRFMQTSLRYLSEETKMQDDIDYRRHPSRESRLKPLIPLSTIPIPQPADINRELADKKAWLQSKINRGEALSATEAAAIMSLLENSQSACFIELGSSLTLHIISRQKANV
jgi:hypothetical protein